jgi:acyl carrier protein phosphodiesterase
MKNGQLPNSIKEAFKKSEYKREIPKDPYTKKNKEVEQFDGSGGWVYSPNKRIITLNYDNWMNSWLSRKTSIKIIKDSLKKIRQDSVEK